MDPVNKVIAAILDADLTGGVTGGKKRSKSRKSSPAVGGLMGSFQTRVRQMAGGEAPTGAPVVAQSEPESPLTGGRRRRSPMGRKRALPARLKMHHAKVMQRYDAIRNSPKTRNIPGNEALKMAMMSVR
jgi:hypothetical protein